MGATRATTEGVMATPPIATVATAVAMTLPVVMVAAVASPVIQETARCNTDAVTAQRAIDLRPE
jgi:hypothetical protein